MCEPSALETSVRAPMAGGDVGGGVGGGGGAGLGGGAFVVEPPMQPGETYTLRGGVVAVPCAQVATDDGTG